MTCSLIGHHAEVHYQCKSSSHQWAALRQGYKCSPYEWQHRRITVGTTGGVRQECLLSPNLVNIFLQRIESNALEEHDGKVSIGGRNSTNLRFAYYIDALAEKEQELEALVESLDETCTRYKMEISAENIKLTTNSASGNQREIKIKGQKLDTVTSFKHEDLDPVKHVSAPPPPHPAPPPQ